MIRPLSSPSQNVRRGQGAGLNIQSTCPEKSAGGAAPFEVEVFFDNDCPLCRREIDFLRKRDKQQRIRFTDISAADFDPADTGRTQAELMAEIHGRLPTGEIIRGVEVFRRLYRAIGFRRLVALTRWPLVAPALDWAYRIFARYRLRLTGRAACDGDRCHR